MTKRITISAATLLIVGSLLTYGAIRAYAAASLLGGSSLAIGYVNLVSDTGTPMSGISFDDANGKVFSNLSMLILRETWSLTEPRSRLSALRQPLPDALPVSSRAGISLATMMRVAGTSLVLAASWEGTATRLRV